MPNQDEKNSAPAEVKKDIKPAAKAKAKAKKPAAPKAKTNKPAAAKPEAKKPGAPKPEVKTPFIEGDFVIMENKAGQRHFCTRQEMETAREITGKAYDWKEIDSATNSQDAEKICQK